MNELKNMGISDSTIAKLNNNLSSEEVKALESHRNLIQSNIKYLQDMGLNNIDIVFSNYYYMFLLDSTKFQSIFNKYEAADLVDKINKNVEVIEFL